MSGMVEPSAAREVYADGEQAWFEYHCWEDPASGDAPAWYHSHQRVTVLRRNLDDDGWRHYSDATFVERCDAGMQGTYRVRFQDDLEWDVFEDELMDTTDHYCRPDPPTRPSKRR